MACGANNSLVGQLCDLVKQIDTGPSCCPPPSGCYPQPCGPCPPCCGGESYITQCINKPYVQCTMLCPPPCMIPIQPQPVKPLQLPCPKNENHGEMPEEQALKLRYANFYNNYNIDYHNYGDQDCGKETSCTAEKRRGTTVNGSDPCCEDYTKQRDAKRKKSIPGCPTGFKPCKLKLTAPPNCDPAGIWLAQVQPCPPKPRKKVSTLYKPGPCKRPGCKHWRPKEGPCLYDEPCKAHCYNHPPGMKPKKRH